MTFKEKIHQAFKAEFKSQADLSWWVTHIIAVGLLGIKGLEPPRTELGQCCPGPSLSRLAQQWCSPPARLLL